MDLQNTASAQNVPIQEGSLSAELAAAHGEVSLLHEALDDLTVHLKPVLHSAEGGIALAAQSEKTSAPEPNRTDAAYAVHEVVVSAHAAANRIRVLSLNLGL